MASKGGNRFLDRRPTRNSSQTDTNRCSPLDGNLDICNKCSNTVADGEKALQCENCLHWWHSKCISLSDQDYKLAKKLKYLKFICPPCDVHFDQTIFGTQQESTPQSNDTDVKKQLELLTGMLHNVLERLTQMENGGTQTLNSNLEKKIEDVVEAKLQDALEEQRAKEAKKLNLIVVNLRESGSANLSEAKEEDKKAFEGLLKEILPEDDIQVQNPIRLGRRQIGNKPRLLRVSVSEEKTKWNIIKNAHKLNSNGKRNYKIYINPDQTLKEREEYKTLKEELDRRTAEGETNLKIERIGSKRQVVRRCPQEDGCANENH